MPTLEQLTYDGHVAGAKPPERRHRIAWETPGFRSNSRKWWAWVP
ncbi:MAG TPA: hypothetical protein VMI13_03795 [Solirubrobacteraceae bacterium]|nr:hypothetical protein [Solirubrobacteraceae bacterium]